MSVLLVCNSSTVHGVRPQADRTPTLSVRSDDRCLPKAEASTAFAKEEETTVHHHWHLVDD